MRTRMPGVIRNKLVVCFSDHVIFSLPDILNTYN